MARGYYLFLPLVFLFHVNAFTASSNKRCNKNVMLKAKDVIHQSSALNRSTFLKKALGLTTVPIIASFFPSVSNADGDVRAIEGCPRIDPGKPNNCVATANIKRLENYRCVCHVIDIIHIYDYAHRSKMCINGLKYVLVRSHLLPPLFYVPSPMSW